jgi:hypothetical protein
MHSSNGGNWTGAPDELETVEISHGFGLRAALTRCAVGSYTASALRRALSV